MNLELTLALFLVHRLLNTEYSSTKLVDRFDEDQKALIKELESTLESEHVIGELDKLNFNEDLYARFLTSQGFDLSATVELFKGFLDWRKEHHVNTILEHEDLDECEEDIKNYLPHGWHQVDKQVFDASMTFV